MADYINLNIQDNHPHTSVPLYLLVKDILENQVERILRSKVYLIFSGSLIANNLHFCAV